MKSKARVDRNPAAFCALCKSGGVKWRWGKIACQESGRHPLRMSLTQLQDGWRSLSPRRNVPLLQDACVRRKIQSVQSKSHLGQLSMRDGRATCYADLFCCRLFGCFGTGRTINEQGNTLEKLYVHLRLLWPSRSLFHCIFIVFISLLSWFIWSFLSWFRNKGVSEFFSSFLFLLLLLLLFLLLLLLFFFFFGGGGGYLFFYPHRASYTS